jgi:hypothetical protein
MIDAETECDIRALIEKVKSRKAKYNSRYEAEFEIPNSLAFNNKPYTGKRLGEAEAEVVYESIKGLCEVIESLEQAHLFSL